MINKIQLRQNTGSVAARLSLPKSTLENWVKAAERGKLGDIGKSHRPLTELEVELARVKRELAIAQMERDTLKKAAAYFAKESLHGTRTLFSPSHVVSYFWGFCERLSCMACSRSLQAVERGSASGSGDPGGSPTYTPDLWSGEAAR